MPDRPPTDLVVVLPGITGSTLYRNERPIWEPSGGAVLQALFTLGRNLEALALPEGIGDEDPEDGIVPVALVDDVHVIPGIWTPVKGYTRLLDRLRVLGYRRPTADTPGNLLPMPYDWRLSNRLTAARIAPTIHRELERWRAQGGEYADARVDFVCHSMGGLVARWYRSHHGADHTGRIITFGTPMRGSMNAVDQLVNGAPTRLGPLRPLITRLGRTMPSLHQLLPSYACVMGGPGAELRYLDPASVPGGDARMIADGLEFHRQLEMAELADSSYGTGLHAILGINQPTHSTVRFTDTAAEVCLTYGADDYMGDATVPLVGAVPKGLTLDDHSLRRVCDYHGNLQRNMAALDEMEGILTTSDVVIKGEDRIPLSVSIPPLVTVEEPLEVDVVVPPGERPGLHVTVRSTDTAEETTRVLRLSHGRATARFTELRSGAYVVDVTGAVPGSAVTAVSGATVVLDPAGLAD